MGKFNKELKIVYKGFKLEYVGVSNGYFTNGREYEMYQDVDNYWCTISDIGKKHGLGWRNEFLDVNSFIRTNFKVTREVLKRFEN